MAAGNPKKFKASCIAACIILAATCLYVLEFMYNGYYIGTYMDDANYIILAESIANGQGYRICRVEAFQKDVVVMTPHPMPWYVHLHRQTVPHPQPGSSGAEILNDISESKVAYILISRPLAIPRPISLDPLVAEVSVPLLRSQPNRFHQVYDDPQNDVTIYQVISH